MKIYYFGCWNEAGHYLFTPGGEHSRAHHIEYFGGEKHIHLDGSLAPRMHRENYMCWYGNADTKDERHRIDRDSREFEQGKFLLHHLDTGYTAIQWWDRCQGDQRPGCNGTLLVEGKRTADEMVAALKEHFPHVVANLEKAGVKLVEVKLPVTT